MKYLMSTLCCSKTTVGVCEIQKKNREQVVEMELEQPSKDIDKA